MIFPALVISRNKIVQNFTKPFNWSADVILGDSDIPQNLVRLRVIIPKNYPSKIRRKKHVITTAILTYLMSA